MNCSHIHHEGESKEEMIRILAKERNSFAKSRQEWIVAAFRLSEGDSSEFNRLVSEELCETCLTLYRTPE